MPSTRAHSRPFEHAWHDALYGPKGFYRTAAPVEHFRTSAHASPLLAKALARLARECGLSGVVDIGSGRGELLNALADVGPGLELVGVDVVPRPTSLLPSARWVDSPGGPDLPDLGGAAEGALVVANEWLDDVPCPVLQVDDRGRLRVVHTTREGSQTLGDPPTAPDLEWVRRWWPVDGAPPGTRVEVGRSRDLAWASLVRQAHNSVLVAIDYAHHAASRPPTGTLVGFRAGRQVAPVPDGSCDITAHVAMDAVAEATPDVTSSVLTTQREALQLLGITAEPPPHALATQDPTAYLAALANAGEAGELLARDGLGGFVWLVQSRGPQVPPLCP